MKAFCAVVLGCGLTVLAAAAPARAAEPYRLRWVLAHNPVSAFALAAKEFAEVVEADTKGGVKVEVVTADQYAGGRYLSPAEITRRVAAGEIEMTQSYTTSLGQFNDQLWALEMPYLFRDHSHAKKVLDGPIGKTLLASLVPHRIRGLAFTYSGGYRVIPTSGKEIHNPEDVKGLKVKSVPSPVAQYLFESLGAKTVGGNLTDLGALAKSGSIDASETTLPRYWEEGEYKAVPVINETNHSLFLTAILINEKFFESLPKDYQAVVVRAATRVGEMERAKSIKDADDVNDRAISLGMKVVSLTPEEQKKWENAVKPVYDHFEPRFGAIVSEIRDTH